MLRILLSCLIVCLWSCESSTGGGSSTGAIEDLPPTERPPSEDPPVEEGPAIDPSLPNMAVTALYIEDPNDPYSLEDGDEYTIFLRVENTTSVVPAVPTVVSLEIINEADAVVYTTNRTLTPIAGFVQYHLTYHWHDNHIRYRAVVNQPATFTEGSYDDNTMELDGITAGKNT